MATVLLLALAAIWMTPGFLSVYRAGDLGYACFMNPAVIAHNRTVWAFAEARWPSCGDFDCSPDPRLGGRSVCGRHDIALRTSRDGGASWTAARIVVSVDTDFGSASSANASIFNVSPVLDQRSGNLVVLFNLQPAPYNTYAGIQNPKCRETFVVVSADGGATFSAPRNVTAQLQRAGHWSESRNPFATTPGPGIQLGGGELLVPGYGCALPAREHCVTYSLNSTIRAWSYRSSDGGETWSMGAPAPAIGAGEPMIVELPDKRLLMNARPLQWPHDGKPHPGRHRLYAVSIDSGATWQAPLPGTYENLTGPTCEASFIRSRGQLLFANPSNNIKRLNMTFRVSNDWAKSWASAAVVYPNSSWYSSLAVVEADGDVRMALLLFVKDCSSPIRLLDGVGGIGDSDSGTCKSISLWRTALSD